MFITVYLLSSQMKLITLFFVIMMSKLLSNTEEASDALTKRIRYFDISNLQGENVDKATLILGGAFKRLAHINRVPQNIFRTMLKIMQTASVTKFNNTFELIVNQLYIIESLVNLMSFI
jgi:hypothetical protein